MKLDGIIILSFFREVSNKVWLNLEFLKKSLLQLLAKQLEQNSSIKIAILINFFKGIKD